MIKIEKNEVYTTKPQEKRVRRVNEDIYFVRGIILPNETIDSFEEVDIPTDEEEYHKKRVRKRMEEIKKELASMDYLTSKYIDGEDMSEYGAWQSKRRALRAEYHELEPFVNGA